MNELVKKFADITECFDRHSAIGSFNKNGNLMGWLKLSTEEYDSINVIYKSFYLIENKIAVREGEYIKIKWIES